MIISGTDLIIWGRGKVQSSVIDLEMVAGESRYQDPTFLTHYLSKYVIYINDISNF